MSDTKQMEKEISEVVERYGWELASAFPLDPANVQRSFIIRPKQNPPDLGIHIRDGVGADDKVGG